MVLRGDFDAAGLNVAAIVTGGASGLGAACARKLAAKGAKVAIFDLNSALGEQLAAEIGGQFFSVDVADEGAVRSAVEAAEAAHGVARVLVNCAGVGIAAKTVDRDGQPHPLESFRKIIEINLVGTFNVLSKVAARLSSVEPLGEERGVIINTASVAAFDGQMGQAAYSASKGGIVGMTLPIARDLARSWHPGGDDRARGFSSRLCCRACPRPRKSRSGSKCHSRAGLAGPRSSP